MSKKERGLGLELGVCDERVVLPCGEVSTIEVGGVALTLRALDDGRVWAEPEGHVLLRVTDPMELLDGDLVGAGRQWLSFQAGREGLPGRLHVLDGDGATRFGFTLRAASLTLGRACGDVLLPEDDALSELHLQVLVRPGGTYVQDLASAGGTWLAVRSGDVLRSGDTLALGDRLVLICTVPNLSCPEGRTAGRTTNCPGDEDDWPTRVNVAA